MNAKGANAYAQVELDTSVISADPHKLILLLYQGALTALSQARKQMLKKETAAKGKSISHAIRIIDEGLKTSLDKNVGGELAQNLAALYSYMVERLVIANLKDDTAILDEVSDLLTELKGAWEDIRPKLAAANASAPLKEAVMLTYGKR